MTERSTRLLSSLVGVSIEFRCSRAEKRVTNMDECLKADRERISKSVEVAHSVGGNLCTVLLGELTSYYRNQHFYSALRGSIEMRRYRPKVLDYLKMPISERADILQGLFLSSSSSDIYRSAKVEALKYFLNVYPGRLKDFKRFLTKSELLIVA